jgi:CheY-like chemotaxis protein
MANNGTITITTESANEGREVALVVSDTGEGMDEKTLARCREPFFSTKGRRGIGLGLATVVSIVERAGGRLDIDSVLGQGTTIRVSFPVATEAGAAEPEQAPHAPARVLLVDDDELIRRYAGHVLVDAGYEMVSFGDAESGLAWIDDGNPFDLLVSDVVLPGMSGFDLVRAVERRRPNTARLLMTGFAGTDTWGTDMRDVEILRKPFSIDEFIAAVSHALESHRQGASQGSKR